MTTKRYWIGVAGPLNFDILQKGGFTLFAVSERFRNIMNLMSPGNMLVIYRAGGAGPSGFTVLASVVSGPYMDEGRDFPTTKPLPRRVEIKPEIDVSDRPVKISEIADGLDFVKKKTIPGTYLQTHLREISEHDYQTIASALKERLSNVRREH